jgi:nucleoside-diphosphate-sugar epimerase
MRDDGVLVLGATGSFGAGAAIEFVGRGLGVRCLVRNPDKARKLLGSAPNLELIQGDVQNRDLVARAADRCAVLVHAVNYPYHEWVPNMERATGNVIAAAQSAGATILFPGNVYGLGPQTGAPLKEDAPNMPNTRKGTLRVKLEQTLREAAEKGPCRVLVLRAGDYCGPTVRNGLVDPLFGNAVRGKAMWTLGNLNVAHQWAYIPDLARAGGDLLALQKRLAAFELVHFAGHLADPERDFVDLVAREAGHPGLPVRVYPWWLLRLVGIFQPQVRELIELRYLFDSSVILDGTRLCHLLPGYADTPVVEAVRATLDSYK